MSVKSKCVDTLRILSAEGIQKAKSGHPGICMGAAPIGFEVFADFLNFAVCTAQTGCRQAPCPLYCPL